MRVLIAEDDRTSRTILTAILKKWGYDAIAVEDGTAAWEIMASSEAAKLVLLDWNMPGMDGLEICRRLREREKANPAYIILLTANTEIGDIVQGLEAGASDYICKPYNNEELLARIRVGERMLKLQADLNEAKGILAHQAMHDPLTNVYNRRAITDVLEHEISRVGRTGKRVSVGLCDLDYFKQINDCHGHETGDRALVAFTRAVEETLRGSDYLGRWGGEEFLVIAAETGEEEANSLFQRIRAATEAVRVPGGDGKEDVNFTVSIGCTRGTGAETAEALIRAADEALYKAKERGRNCVIFISPGDSRFESCDTPG